MSIEKLREAYMESKDLCTRLGSLRDATDDRVDKEKIEQVRQKMAAVGLEIWRELEKAVMRDWCNKTDTPMLFHRLPPKDMPKRG